MKSFAETICRQINASRYYIQDVKYNTLKLYVNSKPIINKSINVDGRILTPDYFDILSDNLIYPSLFVKPEAFKNENEVRIVFEMPDDHYQPFQFNNSSLTDLISY